MYHHFTAHGRGPEPNEIASAVGAAVADVLEAYTQLRASRVLLIKADGQRIRSEPLFPESQTGDFWGSSSGHVPVTLWCQLQNQVELLFGCDG